MIQLRFALVFLSLSCAMLCQTVTPQYTIIARRGADPNVGLLEFLVGEKLQLSTPFFESNPIPAGTYPRCSATLTASAKEKAIYVVDVPDRRGIFIRKGNSPKDSNGSLVVDESTLEQMWNLAGKDMHNITVQVVAPSGSARTAARCVAKVSAGFRPIVVLVAGLSGATNARRNTPADVHLLDSDCRLESEPNKDIVYLPLYGGFEWRRASGPAQRIHDLLQKDTTRPIVLIGHSMGGDTVYEICTKLWENHQRRIDLVISLDPVDLGGKSAPPKGGPGAVVQLVPQDRFPLGTPLHGVLTFEVANTSHTNVDGDEATLRLLEDFVGQLPKKGINSWGAVCHQDYAPVPLPRSLEDLPASVRSVLQGRARIVTQ